MARITTFEAGSCTHPGCVALRGGPLRACAFPSRVYLLEAGGRAWIWDTGYATHFHDHTRSGLFSIYRRVTPVQFESRQAIAAQLRALGLPLRDLAGVILSHFHGDHVAGLRDFPDAVFVCSGEGWRATRTLCGIAALRRGVVPGLFPGDFEARLRFVESFEPTPLPAELAPFETAWALPGADGEILVVPLPGHAAGHLGAFVRTEDGWVLLASDSSWSPKGYRERRGPSRLAHLIMEDRRAYYATLDRLHALDRAGRVRILLTHEGAL